MAGEIFGGRLLIIDDEPAIGRLIKRAAEGLGFDVIAVSDPQSFVRTARTWEPSLIILDLQMPGTDGIELLRQLAADKCRAHVLLASGFDRKVLQSARKLGEARGLNMGPPLEKPFAADLLREVLGRYRPVPKTVLASDLTTAIPANHLFLEYQPKFDLRRRSIAGVEALVRWRHPLHGIVPPYGFVTLAEESDLIHLLTDWVFRALVEQIAIWQRENIQLQVAVNISAQNLTEDEFPERVDRYCRTAEVAPDGIILELTETGAMREAVQMMDVLTRLRLKGFHLAIDDFGTGYSSLVQLQRMPFSELKIDRAFVAEMVAKEDCRTITEIMAELARRLGLCSVAEGVEDEATLRALIDIGCDMAQGYHLGRPMAAECITQLVRSGGECAWPPVAA
jgi:EAL domain-containing protein (putative c-di-GMP-specific phosphodiesterase class I)